MSIVGRTYLEAGRPVVVVCQWASTGWRRPPEKSAPRNVAVCRDDGTMVVRPFRGLRKPKPDVT